MYFTFENHSDFDAFSIHLEVEISSIISSLSNALIRLFPMNPVAPVTNIFKIEPLNQQQKQIN